MTYFNNLGQARVGWRIPSGNVTPTTLWNSVYGVWNADTLGTSLDTSIFRVYNGDNVNDTSGNAQNGTNVGGVTFTTGKVGNAFTFNGSNNISLPTNSLNLTGNYSMNLWLYLPSSPNSTLLSVFGNDGTNKGFYIDLTNSSSYTFRFVGFNNGNVAIALNAGGNNGYLSRWSMATLTVSGTSVKIYLDGSLVSSGTMTSPINYIGTTYPTLGAFRIGNGTPSSYLGNGVKIDALTTWTKELTESEVVSLYNEGTGAEYPFSSQTLPSLNDAVGTNNGTRPSSTLSGGVPGPSFTAGKIGKAFNFDGINDIVSLANNSLDLTGDFSISMWANWGRNNTSQILMSNFTINPNTRGWFIEHAAGQLRFRGFNSTGGNAFYIQYGYTPPLNTWVHYTFVHKNNDNQMYINGVQVLGDTSSSTHVAYESTNWPMIGANRYNPTTYQEFFLGKLDTVSVWNRALTAADVTDLYNSGTGKQYPN